MRRTLYIHERATWPKLTWDRAALSAVLAAVRHKQGRLLGRMEGLGFDLRKEASLGTLTSEVVKSSAIEGAALSPEEVRSSIASRLGLDVAGLPKAGRDVEGIVEVMLDATGNSQATLTKRRLFDWHAALFPTGRSGMGRIAVGAWREADSGPMQVVSGAMGKERVHFEAPESGRLEQEMANFLAWFNGPGPVDPVLKAAIAHFWFVTIHPFDDGNGRIARAIAEMALSRADGTSERFYSMSSQIAAERKDYYLQLESAQRGDTDITGWLGWFLACLDRALDGVDEALAGVMNKAKLCIGSTGGRSMSGSGRSSTACWEPSRGTSRRPSTRNSRVARTTRPYATSRSCRSAASSSATTALAGARATGSVLRTTFWRTRTIEGEYPLVG